MPGVVDRAGKNLHLVGDSGSMEEATILEMEGIRDIGEIWNSSGRSRPYPRLRPSRAGVLSNGLDLWIASGAAFR